MFTVGKGYVFLTNNSMNMSLFHDKLLCMLVFILVSTGYILLLMALNKFVSNSYIEDHSLELLWTIIPCLMLLYIMFPSFSLLKSANKIGKTAMEGWQNIIMKGKMWYWEYNLAFKKKDKECLEMTSLSLDEKELDLWNKKIYRLMSKTCKMGELDSGNYKIFSITSTDVIHSFSMPTLGLKVDAVPGRVKEFFLAPSSLLSGVYRGQCSELCGAYHFKMPMKIRFFNSSFLKVDSISLSSLSTFMQTNRLVFSPLLA